MKRASITKRPYTYKGKTEDRWVVLWTDPNGKRCEKSFHNKRHAEAHATKLERDAERGIHEAGRGKITLGEAWKKWIAYCEHRHRIGDLAGNTLANYRWGADHILPEFGQRQIGKITSADVKEFRLKKRENGSLSGRPLEPKSVDNICSYLYAAFEFWVEKTWLDSNPLRDHPIKSFGEKNRPYWASFEDIELLIQILHGAQPQWCNTITWENQKIAFALRAFAGLRGGEVAALRWDKIDMSRTTLSVDEKAGTISSVDGPKKPKSKAGVRTVPICQYLYDALSEHAHATDMNGFVIKNQDNPDMYLGAQAVSDMHHELMKRANLTKPSGKGVKFTGHDLRHWNCSALISIGHNLVAVAKRLGHESAAFTAKRYAHVIEGTEDGTKESVPPIWHQRLARAEPGRATMIEGVASESTLVIDGTATRLLETPIPDNAYPWVPEALRLLEGGWRVADVTRQLGQARTSINAAFHRLGLPTPDQIRVKVRDRMFGELRDAGHTDKQIAKKMNCSEGTVYHWRLTNEAGVPNTRAEFRRLKKAKRAGKKLTDDQVREVLDRLDAGESHAAIGKRFSVSHGLIGNIKSGRNYGSVKQDRGKNGGTLPADKLLKYKEKTTSSQVVPAAKLRESQLKLL